MCLTNVIERFNPVKQYIDWQPGYKLVRDLGIFGLTTLYNHHGGSTYNFQVEIEIEDRVNYEIVNHCHQNIKAGIGPEMYQTGFHLFTKLIDAQKYYTEDIHIKDGIKLYSIVYNNVTCIGKQSGVDVVVAKKIKFLDEIKDWLKEQKNENEKVVHAKSK